MLAIDIFMFLVFASPITMLGTLEIYKNIEKKYYMEAADKGFKEASDAPSFVDSLLQSFSSLPKMILCTCVPFLNLIIAIFKSLGINKERRLKIIINSVKKHWLIEMNGKEKEYYQKHRSYATLQKIKRPQITFTEMPKDMSIIELDTSNPDKDTISYDNDTELSKKIDDILHGDVVITESDVDLFRVIKKDRWPNRYLELKEKIKAIKDLDLDSNRENELVMEILKSYRQENLLDDNINNNLKVKKIKR